MSSSSPDAVAGQLYVEPAGTAPRSLARPQLGRRAAGIARRAAVPVALSRSGRSPRGWAGSTRARSPRPCRSGMRSPSRWTQRRAVAEHPHVAAPRRHRPGHRREHRHGARPRRRPLAHRRGVRRRAAADAPRAPVPRPAAAPDRVARHRRGREGRARRDRRDLPRVPQPAQGDPRRRPALRRALEGVRRRPLGRDPQGDPARRAARPSSSACASRSASPGCRS